MNTVTRAQLAETIYAQVGLSRNESSDLLENVLARVAATLEAGESVKISGFGTFSVRQKGRRIGRNPKTGKEVPILPRRVLVFRPSHVLKARVNGGTAVRTMMRRPTAHERRDRGRRGGPDHASRRGSARRRRRTHFAPSAR